MPHLWYSTSYESHGVLRARGPDVGAFLQGQLSSDVAQLDAGRTLLGGYHNPQGRVIALLRLVRLGPDDVIALLPRELVMTVLSRLAKYILRSRVRLTDDSPAWRISGLIAPESATEERAPLAGLPSNVDAAARIDGLLALRVARHPGRWLLLASAETPFPALPEAAEPATWKQLAIAAGEPEVYAATSEEFVAQMLNLDALGAIAFHKGCYTGQEVIARAHYRGRVKRRLQRFVSRSPQLLAPGTAGTLADGRAFKVVDAVALADGRSEFLAVAPLTGAAAEERSAQAVPAEARPESGAAVLDATQLPLPYSLPE
jgi:tRNA-modifying protein YgfZ